MSPNSFTPRIILLGIDHGPRSLGDGHSQQLSRLTQRRQPRRLETHRNERLPFAFLLLEHG
jgi:hypothetical protein